MSLFLAFKGDSKKKKKTFRFESEKECTTIAGAIVERVITLWRAIKKRSHEAMIKPVKNEAKRLRATTFAIAKLEER